MRCLILLCLLGASCIDFSEGLKCVDCSSTREASCAEGGDANKDRIVDCSTKIGSASVSSVVCLKRTVQIEGKPDEIIRSCAAPPIYDLDTKLNLSELKDYNCNDYEFEDNDKSGTGVLCVCKGDGCNGSENSKITRILILLPILAIVAKII